MPILVKVLTTAGSIVSMGFGIWHFFVPGIWKWYSYMKPDAPELIIAVRALNIFFSLSLVLLGLVNILIMLSPDSRKYPVIVVLSASVVLWITRSVLQVVYPQGSVNLCLQYGMLAAFLITACVFILALILSILSGPW